MARIAFDESKKSWVDLSGLRADIKITPIERDYYYHIPGSDFVLRGFSSECLADKSLGEIITRSGLLVQSIPPFKHPSFIGDYKNYKSHIAWVQGSEGDVVSLVICCSSLNDFRVKFNIKTLVYSEPDFNVR
jgi:hypothetical protein